MHTPFKNVIARKLFEAKRRIVDEAICRITPRIASSNEFPFGQFVFLAMTCSTFFLPVSGIAQTHTADIHGLRPGMLTREIILHSHAPLDTIQWGGGTGPSVIGFSGVYLKDTGTFRINVMGENIVRITFSSPVRTAEQNDTVFQRASLQLTKLLGNPYENYRNVYRIVTWNSVKEQLKLTTTDGGKYYTVSLASQK